MNPHLTVNSNAVIVIPPLIRAKINSNHEGQTRDKPVLENDPKQDKKACKSCLYDTKPELHAKNSVKTF